MVALDNMKAFQYRNVALAIDSVNELLTHLYLSFYVTEMLQTQIKRCSTGAVDHCFGLGDDQ
jgi:hypothetical protein